MPVRMITGLGNPGAGYARTRHNAGFQVLDRLADQWDAAMRGPAGKAIVTRRNVILLKPDLFMNRSGEQVAQYAHKNGIIPGEVLVIVDDFALPLGVLRLRASGSAGGHNGLKSIIECLGTNEFPRLRCGVGPVPEGWDPADFVLGRFAPDELPVLDDMIARAVIAVQDIVRDGITKAASKGVK